MYNVNGDISVDFIGHVPKYKFLLEWFIIDLGVNHVKFKDNFCDIMY